MKKLLAMFGILALSFAGCMGTDVEDDEMIDDEDAMMDEEVMDDETVMDDEVMDEDAMEETE